MEVSLENLYVDIVPYRVKALLNIFHRKWSLIKFRTILLRLKRTHLKGGLHERV